MRTWQSQDAKAHFAELLESSLREGPQLVTQRGIETAVVVSIADWHRMQAAARPSLKDLLLTDQARADFQVPPRGRGKRRQPTEIF